MGRHGVVGPGRDGRPRACRGLYKLCLKRMQKALLPVCKIETGSSGSARPPALCRQRWACPHRMPGLGGLTGAGGHKGSGWPGVPQAPLLPPSLTHYQIRRLLAVVAAAARARSVDETLDGRWR